jgi:alpha-glucosidase
MKHLLLVILFTLFYSISFSQEKKSTATSNVAIINKQFVIPNLNTISHKIWIYLPPNYYTSTKKFPVIYMHDAQNLFDATTSYAGEWKVDETLNDIYKTTKKGFIVVGIENGGQERINEYTPWEHQKYGGGKGDVYINFIVNTLKPYIDLNYRTKPQQKHTGLIGSSLGGLISYYGGLKYAAVFGKIGALSTSFWFSDEVVNFTKLNGAKKSVKMYLLVGGNEGESMDVDTQNMAKLLIETGFKKQNLKTVIHPEGKHNEAFWSSQFKAVVEWLYQIN